MPDRDQWRATDVEHVSPWRSERELAINESALLIEVGEDSTVEHRTVSDPVVDTSATREARERAERALNTPSPVLFST